MAKLTKSRKKEIRELVRDIVANHVRAMDPKLLQDEIAESEEEEAYIKREQEEIASRISYKPAGDEV